MFNNLKIGVRLGLGFAFVLLMLAAISVLSITRINELNAGIDELAEGRIPKIVLADELSLNVQLIGRGVRNMIMTNDKLVEKQQTEAIAKARSRNTEIYEKMTPLVLTEKGKALLAKATDARTKYNGVTDRLLDELAAEAQAVATLRQHNQALMETEEALGLVLVMLTHVDENPPVQLRGSALRNLLEPLHKKLATVTDEMNGVLF